MSWSSYLTEAKFQLAEMRRHLGKHWWTLDMHGAWVIHLQDGYRTRPHHMNGAYEPLPKTGVRDRER